MGKAHLISEVAGLHLAMFVSLAVCTLSPEKRQQPNMAQNLNNLRTQIQTYERSLAECRRHIQLLTGRSQTLTNQRNPGVSGWGWMGGFDDRKRRHSVNTRQLYYGNYWNNNYNQLQNTLQTRVREFNQCVAQLQSIRTAQEEVRNKQQVANNLLQQINAMAINLRACVSIGGRTDVNLPTLFLYISNGGFIQPRNAQPSRPAPSSSFNWGWVGGFEFDDRRRAVLAANVDWTQVLTQRQQWFTFVQQALVKCWSTIGRLPDGSLPTRPPVNPVTAMVLPPQPPPPKTFPPQPPPPPSTTTAKPTTAATTPPPTTTRTTTVATTTTTTKPTSTTTTTTTAPTTTTTLPTTTTQPPTTTTTKPTSTPTTTATTPTTTTTLPTTTTQPPTTTSVSLTTTTALPTTTTTINFTSTSEMVFTTTGPGLTTTFAPLMTTSPC